MSGKRISLKQIVKVVFLVGLFLTLLKFVYFDNQVVVRTCNRCFVNQYKYGINNINICQPTHPGQSVDVLFLILTVHGNREARDAIRRTWMTKSKNNTANVRHVFLLGETDNKVLQEKIAAESQLHQDIIQGNFTDSYNNLTLKTIMGFSWTSTFCSSVKVVIKTDDDMFINWPYLLRAINQNKDNLQQSVLGFCFAEMPPVRNNSSKWYTSHEAYPYKLFPRFCSGTAYVTSIDMILKILLVSENVPFFHLEDVYIGMCLSVLGAGVTHVGGFKADDIPIHDECDYKSKYVLTYHRLAPSMLQSIWKKNCTGYTKRYRGQWWMFSSITEYLFGSWINLKR